MLNDGSSEPQKDDAPLFARGQAAEHPYGVLYQGEWETEHDGNAFAVRKHARALADVGVPVILKSFSNVVVTDGVAEPVPTVGLPQKVRQEVLGLHRTSVSRLAPMVKHMVVANAERFARTLMRGIVGPADRAELVIGAQQAAYQGTIVYSVWERSAISPDIARHLALVAENWVPCHHNAELLRKAGVERVRVVPHPYDPADAICKLVRRRPETGWRLFYSIGKWEPRKGYVELIAAFLRAFKPSDKVVLTIKYSGGQHRDYPTPDEAVNIALSDAEVRANGWTPDKLDGRLVLVGKRLPRSRIVELHYRNNIYVNSSHGEGWCLPAFEAKLAGNGLVHVAYGGTPDFASLSDRRVPFRMGPVHPSYGWEPDAQWAVYDLAQLAEAMKLSTPPEKFERPEGFAQFSKQNVGHQMRARILELTRRLEPSAADYYETLPNVLLRLVLRSGAESGWLSLCGRRIAISIPTKNGLEVQLMDNVIVRRGGFEPEGTRNNPRVRVLEGTEIDLYDVPRAIAERTAHSPGRWIRSAELPVEEG